MTLVNAQGEDVVADIRTPTDISKMKEAMTETYEVLQHVSYKLEQHYQDMQNIEFTIQGGMYLLQTRNGKRTGSAAIKIVVDMVDDGIISPQKAISGLIAPSHLEQLLHPQFEDERISDEDIIGKGLPASPGAAVGKVVFDAESAATQKANNERIILVRIETSPDDVSGMSAAEGILTSRGGHDQSCGCGGPGIGKTMYNRM